jgi:carbonic anhydrase
MLLEGNARFRSGRSNHYRYPGDLIAEIADGQAPQAAVIACTDGRVTPEIVFDQPLGTLFVSRVPGNVASDSAKWMLEIAVTDLQVPLVIVMGHTMCLAVGQIVQGKSGAGGSLRMTVAQSVQRAKLREPEDLWVESVRENARNTVAELTSESHAVRSAISAGRLDLVSAVYNVHTGLVEVLDPR